MNRSTGSAARAVRSGARLDALLAWLLRSRLHGLVSGSHLLVAYRGRRSAREIVLPVRYARAGADFVILVGRPEGKRWWRNFAPSPWPMKVVHRGRPVEGMATAVRGGPEGDRLAAAYAARYRGAYGEQATPPLFVRMRPFGR